MVQRFVMVADLDSKDATSQTGRDLRLRNFEVEVLHTPYKHRPKILRVAFDCK